jgi:hypothetical protein
MTLNEKTYLCDFLSKFVPNKFDEHWELCDRISDLQRKKLLALCYNNKADELINMLEEITNFQQYEPIPKR